MMKISIERKKEFIKAIYIRNFKNNLSKIYTSFALLSQYPKDPEIEEKTIPILRKNLSIFIIIYEDNLNIMVNTMREFKRVKKRKRICNNQPDMDSYSSNGS